MTNTTITLTPNRRLARHFYQAAAIPIDQWLETCYLQSQHQHILLNQHQERLLWQKIIVDILGKEFIGITKTVIKAYELLAKWQISYQELTDDHEDVIAFNKIVQKFTQYCHDNHFITRHQLPSLVATYLHQTKPKIQLLGFDECWPQLQSLLANLTVTKQDPNQHRHTPGKVISCDNTTSELTIAARWAKQIMLKQPKAKIGIVINNLADLRTQVIRIFTQVLGGNDSFNISAGEPLSNLPIIKYTLELLSLSESFSVITISKLLLSNYCKASPEERSARILLAWQLQQDVDAKAKLTITDLTYFTQKYQQNIPEFMVMLNHIQTIIKAIRYTKLLHMEWLQSLTPIWQTYLPPEPELTTTELQAITRLNEALQELTQLDLITGKVYHVQGLGNLRNLLDNTVFQVSTKNNPNLQILGVLEAAGLNFDSLWIMGMDQQNWPKAANPNPFIPIRLQKQFNLPGSSAERELEFCTRLINRFKRSAANIIFSYINQAEDRVIAPSALIADAAAISTEKLDLANFIDPASQIYANRTNLITQQLSTADQHNHHVALMPHETIQGGSRLIEAQSLCPFRAFVEFRLNTTAAKKLEPGITKITRGILIHQILEQFWRQIKTSRQLRTQTTQQLQDIIQNTITAALKQAHIPKHLHHIEQQCLTRLMHRWLEIEKNRDDFTVVATEKTLKTSIGGLVIKLRIDRIDRLENGHLIIIDYKSSKVLPAASDWLGARPTSVQLPLYCIATDKLHGLALAQVNAQSLKLKTIDLAELTANTPNATNWDWQQLTNHWRSVLEQLAQNFVCGHAKVDPLNPQTCQTCAFGLICRK